RGGCTMARATVPHHTRRIGGSSDMADKDSGTRDTSGLGEIKLRGSIWWIRYYDNGRRRQESSGSTKRPKAVALLKRRIKEQEQNGRAAPEKDKVTFDAAAAAVVTDYKINRRRSLPDVQRR